MISESVYTKIINQYKKLFRLIDNVMLKGS